MRMALKARRTEPSKGEISDSMLLEPRTTITSFEGITWALQKAVGGSIAAMLYGKNKEAKTQFYGSPTNRKNKEILVELSSQVYSYLNGAISEYADTKEYAFRIWTQMRVDRKSGLVLGQPIFDVEVYKYVGRVSAQTVEVKDYSLEVVFIGKQGDKFVTPFMNRGLTQAKKDLTYLHLEMYSDPRTAPKPLQRKMVGTFPTLIVDDKPYAVKGKIDEATGEGVVHVADADGDFEFENEEEVTNFLNKKSSLKPEILGVTTAFHSVDKEVKQISKLIKDDATASGTDFMKKLDIESALEKLENTIKSVDSKSLDVEGTRKLKSLVTAVEERKNKSRELRVEYEVTDEDLGDLEKKLQKKLITFDQYETEKVKALTNRKSIEIELIKLQTAVKQELQVRIEDLVSSLKGKNSSGQN